jgi:hypothetical protein
LPQRSSGSSRIHSRSIGNETIGSLQQQTWTTMTRRIALSLWRDRSLSFL